MDVRPVRQRRTVVRRWWWLGVWVGVGIGGWSGCAAPPSGEAGAGPDGGAVAVDVPPVKISEAAEPARAWSPDELAIRGMGGVYGVSISVTGSGGAGSERTVTAREAVLVEEGELAGVWVVEHLLLVGEPAAVARHWSSVWTGVEGGRWSVVESEADGRPSAVTVGRWVHAALPGGGEMLSRFVPEGGSVRLVTTRSPGLAGAMGDWWASTVVRVGPGPDWSRTTEGQLLGADGRARGGAVMRTETYRALSKDSAEVLALAETWWSARRGFWSAVRSWWDGREGASVRAAVDGRPMWRAVLDLEVAVRRGQAVADRATLDAVLGSYVVE